MPRFYLPVPTGDRGTAQGRRGTVALHEAYQTPDGSEYAMEQIFFVIDSRYYSCSSMIITTNLKLVELKEPSDLVHACIYACFKGASH